MARYDVKCPLCPGNVTVAIEDSWAVFRVEGFESDPSRRIARLEPSPEKAVGGQTFAGKSDQRRIEDTCTNGHHLRMYVTHYKHLEHEDCLYGPKGTPDVPCAYCGFVFGTHDKFLHQASLSDENHMILRSVSKKPREGHSEVSVVSRRDCINYDRIAQKKECPHCGQLSYLNYRSYAIEPDTQFIGIYGE